MYLTFDIGTTALKTALVDREGRLRTVHTVEYTPAAPRPGWAEMDPAAYWQAAVAGTRAVLAAADARADAIAAIGFSSQGQTFVPIGRDGRPLHPAIVWVDSRAEGIARQWEQEWLPRDEFRRITGYPWLPGGLTLFQVAWLARHAPAVHRAWKFLCLPDYLIYRLTGETATDRVIAHFSGFLDLSTRAWEPRFLAAAGITPEQLPTVLEPGTVAGRVRPSAAAELGIPAGVPVCVGANDQLAGAVGAGNLAPGIVTETTGTALALIATTPGLLDDKRLCVGWHAVPGQGYALSFANTSAIVLKWLRDLCAPGEGYDAFLAGIEGVPPGCDGLSVIPHFAGTGPPHFDAGARGAFVGLNLGHTRAHLARAVMEACACLLQECLEPLVEGGVPAQSVRSLGGAARSDAWLQMKADLLGIPVERPACPDAASLGAAALAAAGIGHYSTIVECARAWYRPARVFEPIERRHAAYREVYERYRQARDRLYSGNALGR